MIFNTKNSSNAFYRSLGEIKVKKVDQDILIEYLVNAGCTIEKQEEQIYCNPDERYNVASYLPNSTDDTYDEEGNLVSQTGKKWSEYSNCIETDAGNMYLLGYYYSATQLKWWSAEVLEQFIRENISIIYSKEYVMENRTDEEIID